MLKKTMLVVLLVSLTNTVSAQSSRNKSNSVNKVEASIGWRGDRDLSFVNFSSSDDVDYTLSGGFEFTAAYRPWTYLYTGMVYTNYANGSMNEDENSHTISQSQLGLISFLATPWTTVAPKNKRYERMLYRAKIGGVLDATGLKVSGIEDDNSRSGRTLGRLREHRFFASAEVGIKCFGNRAMGIMFLRLSYMRSIYSWSKNGSSTMEFDAGNNDRITFDIGLSI